MTPLYTPDQFAQSRSRDLLPLQCAQCKQTFVRPKHHIQGAIASGRKYDYCCKACEVAKLKVGRHTFKCRQCGGEVLRKPGELATRQRKKLTHHFCSQRCAGTYNSQHRKTGVRRSKLEQWIEKSLLACYPTLTVHYNRTDAVDAELDIFIPSLKLAFELNGIFHYEAIYGSDKLNSTQRNDKRKFQACLEHDIELCVIDTSALKYFKLERAQQYLGIVVGVIEQKLARTSGVAPPVQLR